MDAIFSPPKMTRLQMEDMEVGEALDEVMQLLKVVCPQSPRVCGADDAFQANKAFTNVAP